MPQSLLINTPPQSSGNVAKRQRSADRRSSDQDPVIAGQNGSQTSLQRSGRSHLKANTKVPPYLEKTKAEILSTFQELEWKQRFRLFHAIENPQTSPYKVDRSDIVVARNRYGNVQPWDALRIKLKEPIGGSDYVNASPITLTSKSIAESATSSPTTTKYIATQGPKQGQKSHFWHMVHQETIGDTVVIIMLTQLMESNKEKCAPYFPADLNDPTMTLPHEEDGTSVNTIPNNGSRSTNGSSKNKPFPSKPGSSDTITLLSKKYDSSVECEIRKFKLTINNISKNVNHYLFGRWPDFGKPDANDRKALIGLSRRTLIEAGESPRIVHCSAGVGRTGTWIALDFLVREVEEDRLLNSPSKSSAPIVMNEEAVTANNKTPGIGASDTEDTWGKSGPPKANTPTRDEGSEKDENDLIFETVNTLREQRMMMVMSEVQFSFLYDVVREALFERYRTKAEGAVITDGAAVVDPETAPRQSKIIKTQDDNTGEDEGGVSEAETEIIDVENVEQKVQGAGDEDDPYKAVSPDILRRTLSEQE